MLEDPLRIRHNDLHRSNGKDRNPYLRRAFRPKKTVVDPPAKDEAVKPSEKPLATSFIAYRLPNEQPTQKTAVTDITSTEQDTSGLQSLHRLGMSNARIQQIQEADSNEKNTSILATITSLLAKQAADISRTKEKLLEAVKQRYEALAFIADDTEEYNITKTSEFQKLIRLFSKKGINTKGCLNETERYLNSLPRLSMEINSLQQPVNNEARKKIENYVRGCTKQIEITHQREIDLEEQLTTYEKVEKQLIAYREGADDYQAPAVRDTPRQARERAEQAKQRREQARQRAKQAATRLEEATSRHSLNIDPELSKASLAAVEQTRKVAKLEYQCALQADNIFNFAHNKTAELEKNPEKYTIDDDKLMIKDEQGMLEKEKKLLSSLKDAQTKEVEALKQEKKAFSEYQIKSATDEKDIDENKDKRQSEQVLLHKKTIDEAIEHISSKKIPEVQEKLKECDTINVQYKTFDPNGKQTATEDRITINQGSSSNTTDTEIEKISLEAHRATSLAEQYEKRAKQTRDRVKEYKQLRLLLKACNPTRSFSRAISIAEQIATKEQNIRHEYFTIARNADAIVKLQNSSSDNKQEEIELCQSRIEEAKEAQKAFLLQIQDLHKKELNAINSYKKL